MEQNQEMVLVKKEADPKVVKAYEAMSALGVSKNITKRVLKDLWNVYRNWDFIEAENYRVLADAIFDYQDSLDKEEVNKRKDTDMCNDSETAPKRLRSTLVSDNQLVYYKLEDGEEDVSQSLTRGRVIEPAPAGPSGSRPMDKRNENKRNDVIERKLGSFGSRQEDRQSEYNRKHVDEPRPGSSGSRPMDRQNEYTRRDVVVSRPGSFGSRPMDRQNEYKRRVADECRSGSSASRPMDRQNECKRRDVDESKPGSSASRSIEKKNEYKRMDVCEPKPISVLPHPRERGREHVSPTYKQDTEGVSHSHHRDSRRESSLPSRHASQRAKGKKPISERVVVGVSFQEPRVEHSNKMARNDFQYNAVTAQRYEPVIGHDPRVIGDDPEMEVPIAMLRPLGPCPVEKKDEEDGSHDISHKEHDTGLSLELTNTSENSFSNFEIASTPLGEVKISLSCSSSTGRPNFSMPGLDEVLKLAREGCLKSHKIIYPNCSLIQLMDDLCQYFLGLTSNPNNDIDATRSGIFRKNGNSLAVIGYEGSHQSNNCTVGSSSNRLQSGVDDLHIMSSNKKFPGCNGERKEKRDRNGCESSNSQSLMLVPHRQFNLDGLRPPHDLGDISKGLERVKISVVNQINSEVYPPVFHYISHNTSYQNAYINFSLARIGDEDSCLDCFGDCLISPIPCACARETGGEFAYKTDGIIRKEFLDECISRRRDSHLYYCNKDCPLARKKNGFGQCKGHFTRKFIKECWRKCGCNMQCGNRVVQRGITHNLQVFFTSEEKGWGVRTTEDLPRGTFVCEYIGEILTNTELYNRNEESTGNETHTYPVLLDADWYSEERLEDEEALCLDATKFGNIARFINHRCYDSNVVEIPVEIETPDHHYYHVAFFTSRNVGAMEELTWDYGIDFHDVNHPIKAFRCRCGSKHCRDTPLAKRTDSKVQILR